MVNLKEVFFFYQIIICKISSNKKDLNFYISFVYRSNNAMERNDMWNDMTCGMTLLIRQKLLMTFL